MIAILIYNLVQVALSPLILLAIVWEVAKAGSNRRQLLERSGLIPAGKLTAKQPRVWLHVAALGEAMAAKPVWDALRQAFPGWSLYHSARTMQGLREVGRTVNGQGQAIAFPLDILPCTWLALARVRPRLIVIMESELWPNFLLAAKWMRCKVVLVNGRLSDRAYRQARHLRPICRWMMSRVDLFCMQSRLDADRFIELGANPARVLVVGNSKFDRILSEFSPEGLSRLRAGMGLSEDELIVLAGSTHEGEEETVLQAYGRISAQHPGLRLVIAPRNIQRADDIMALAQEQGYAAVRRTELSSAPAPPGTVIVLDTTGELARVYALCTVAFVGGSLIPKGGHSILEPLAVGKPVAFGPHMHNFRDITAQVLQAGAGATIANAEELAEYWQQFLVGEHCRLVVRERAQALFASQRGAAQRCVQEIARLMATEAPVER